MHDDPDVNVVTFPQFSRTVGVVTMEEVQNSMDDLVFGLSIDYWENLVWKLCGDLVQDECYLVNVKDSDFEVIGKISNLQ